MGNQNDLERNGDRTERSRNVLLIVSDQHNKRMTGHGGHPLSRTPALDALAERGTVFDSAYCTSPICVPSRASMATGRYVHDLGTWDNAAPYTGSIRSWGHALVESGYRVTTVGKLHYRDSGDDTGFPDQRLAMHVHEGGDLRGVSLRPEGRVPDGGGGLQNILNVGSGESQYTRFDRAVARTASDFLRYETRDGPWALMVSFVSPHFPLIAPEEFFEAIDPNDIPLPAIDSGAWDHPAVETFRRAFGLSRALTDDEQRAALHAYLALCSFLDSQVGEVLSALEASGQSEETLVVYTSDHGESAGAHGLWFKHLMNEESVGVPFFVAGPGVAAGEVVDTPISHIDLFPTFLDWAGVTDESHEPAPGLSLLDMDRLASAERPVMAEYHANGSASASFMLRHGRYKYIEYVDGAPQLFDLIVDPDETVDLANDDRHSAALVLCAQLLRAICDPVEVDARAKADQARRVAEVGGTNAAQAITVPYTPVPESLDLT
ncbi:MAG: sulfatase-like hydrolase/transferase [Acidimicrobiia bacterium]|nr:sulfatase-like hydrolase/transferase [Acidimicrobiia bacterium]